MWATSGSETNEVQLTTHHEAFMIRAERLCSESTVVSKATMSTSSTLSWSTHSKRRDVKDLKRTISA